MKIERFNVFEKGEPLLSEEQQNELNEFRKKQMDPNFKEFTEEEKKRFMELYDKENKARAKK